MRIKGIHHVTIAARDADQAAATFAALFDAAASDVAEIEPFRIRARDIALGSGALQVVSPLGADNPVVRFLERKGEGFYNLALEVEALDDAVAELRGRDIRVSDPVEATAGVRSAFITMAATHGLSIQLVEIAQAEDGSADSADSKDEVAEAPGAPEPQPLLDLSPDEWSDVD